MRLKKETRLTLYVAAWAITLVMGIAGVKTYYAANPSPVGAITAVALFLGFLLTLKGASSILFDGQQNGLLRFLSLLVVIAVFTIDIFAFSHDKQSGVMEKVEQARIADMSYKNASAEITTLNQQLMACPENHYTKCKQPLLNRINALHADRQNIVFSSNNAGERSYWESVANWYNDGKDSENHVDAGTIALYIFGAMGAIGSLFVVFGFGVYGASENNDAPNNPTPHLKPTGTDDYNNRYESPSIGFGIPSTAKRSFNPNASQSSFTHARSNQNYTPPTTSDGGKTRAERKAETRWGMTPVPSTLGNLALQVEPELDTSVQVRSSDETSVPIGESDSYERTSTLESEQNQTEYAQNESVEFTHGGYMEWRKAVVSGHCDTIVRDTKQWLIDRKFVDANNNRKAQRLAEQYLSDAEHSGFVRVVKGWTSGMRRKYEWTGESA